MNYDFTDKEFTLFIDIHTRISQWAKENNLENSDAELSEHQIRQALNQLSKTVYLTLAMEKSGKSDEYNGLLTLMGAMEVIGAISPSLLLSVETSTRIFGRILSTWGSDAQKADLLAPLIDGQLIGAVGISEDAMNVENDALMTTGAIDGDVATISGQKQYVINAPMADWFAVAGTVDGKNALFLVQKDTPGLSIGKKVATMGYQGAAISKIMLSECKIPATQVIYPQKAEQLLGTLKLWENQVLIGASLGLMKAAFESARDYAKTHKTGGKPIIAYQKIGFKLSEMLTLFQTSQLFAYKAAWSADADPKDLESLTLCAKVFCTEAAEQVTAKAMRILGGAGFVSGNTVEQSFRCAEYGLFAGTSTEISRVKIGDNALGAMK